MFKCLISFFAGIYISLLLLGVRDLRADAGSVYQFVIGQFVENVVSPNIKKEVL
jgi:hypothetical protein